MAEPLDLDAIEARCAAATPGPWFQDHDSGEDENGAWENPLAEVVDGLGSHLIDAGELADAAFIAHARTDVPDMAAALRAVLELHVRAECPTRSEERRVGKECRL